MTVSELIAELQNMPPHAQVRICSDTELSGLRRIEESERVYEVRLEGPFVGVYA